MLKIVDSVAGEGCKAIQLPKGSLDRDSFGCSSVSTPSVKSTPANSSLRMTSPASGILREVSADIAWDDACEVASMNTSTQLEAEDYSHSEAAEQEMRRYRIDLFFDHRDADLKEQLGRWLRPEELKSWFGVGLKSMMFEVEGHSWHWVRSS